MLTFQLFTRYKYQIWLKSIEIQNVWYVYIITVSIQIACLHYKTKNKSDYTNKFGNSKAYAKDFEYLILFEEL